MSTVKATMTSAYKAVFTLSIVMFFVVLIVGAISGSKTSSVGMLYWGYTAWKMYKRDNESLVLLQKTMLWLQGLLFSIGLGVLFFSDMGSNRYVDITPLGFLVTAILTLSLTYFLYKFFLLQEKVYSNSTSAVNDPSIEDKHWEQASRELGGVRHEATWARAMASSDGNEDKTKALYIKLRAANLQSQENLSSHQLNTSNIKTSFIGQEFKLFWAYFNGIGKLAITAIALLSGYAIYELSSNTSDKSKSFSTPSKSFPQNTPNSHSIFPGENESTKLCLFIWDDSLRVFTRIESDINDTKTFTNIIITKYGKEQYVSSLAKQLEKADTDRNEILARSITKTIRENAITVYYPKSLSADFIQSLADEQKLNSKCINH